MEINDTVNLKPQRGAANRTKNRIRENGPEFVVLTDPQPVRFDRGNRLWIQFESIACNCNDGMGGKEPWVGWLPIDEIEITE